MRSAQNHWTTPIRQLARLYPGVLARWSMALAIGFVGSAFLLSATNAADQPNFIYILADDLGYNELGCYGQTTIRTPNLDRLAGEGMRFTQHYSGNPVCAPSRCVLLTGKHNGHSYIRSNKEMGGWGPDEPEGQLPIPASEITLAERLKPLGYRTCAIGKWGLGGPGSSGHPCYQGFDHFYGYLCQRVAHNYYPTHLWRNHDVDVLGNHEFSAHQKLAAPLGSPEEYFSRYMSDVYAPDKMIDEAVQFVRDNHDEPFFLYYATPVPHVSIQVPTDSLDAYGDRLDDKPYLGNQGYLPHPSPRAGYAAMISRMDRDVGRLMALLAELGLEEKTLVIFSSDNGPTFNGGSDSKFFHSAGQLRGLKTMMYEGGIRVPMIARWKDVIPAGAVTDHVSAFQDIVPTFVEWAGGTIAEPLDGISLVPTLTGESADQQEHPYLYWELNRNQALRAGDWKLIRMTDQKGETRTELYDLGTDLSESKNLASERPDVLTRMVRLAHEARVPSKEFPSPYDDGR